MSVVEMIMPKMGESIMEATILSWLKKEGDQIEQDESVLEVATDKVDTEVPSTHAGILSKILAQEGEVVPVGSPIAEINTDDVIISSNGSNKTEKSVSESRLGATMAVTSPVMTNPAPSPVLADAPVTGRFYSPLVLNIAQKEHISMADLERLPGSGKDGRVTKKDILAFVKSRMSSDVAEPALSNRDVDIPEVSSTGTSQTTKPTASTAAISTDEDEIIAMDRMRKMIASRMVESKQTSPHVTSFVEADVTRVVHWREKVKDNFFKREGEKLTFTPIFIEAVVNAIKDFPMINISVDGDKIIRHKKINVGMAVALPSGNLIVPVVHDTDQYNLSGLAKKVNDLAIRARNNKLGPDELSGGTYSVSNVGSFGNVMGTPIIMQPQVAILALGAIVKKPAVVETEDGDVIAIRNKMFLSHSYDHRVVDGALGGMFVRKVADYLESFDINRTI